MSRYESAKDATRLDVLDRVRCPRCRAAPGRACITVTTPWRTRAPHAPRVALAAHRIPWREGPEGEPIAAILRVTNSSVVVRCPWCTAEHWHGWHPGMIEHSSHRGAHCASRTNSTASGYWIPPIGAALRVGQRTVVRDIAGESNDSPDEPLISGGPDGTPVDDPQPITRLDGKTYFHDVSNGPTR